MDYVINYVKDFGLVKANLIEVLKNCFNFKGRLDRTKYWTFYVFIILANFVLAFFNIALTALIGGTVGIIFSIVFSLVMMALGVVSLGPTACRMRDAGFSPWIMLSYLLCGIGCFVCFIMCFFKTQDVAPAEAPVAAPAQNAAPAPEQPKSPQA